MGLNVDSSTSSLHPQIKSPSFACHRGWYIGNGGRGLGVGGHPSSLAGPAPSLSSLSPLPKVILLLQTQIFANLPPQCCRRPPSPPPHPPPVRLLAHPLRLLAHPLLVLFVDCVLSISAQTAPLVTPTTRTLDGQSPFSSHTSKTTQSS